MRMLVAASGVAILLMVVAVQGFPRGKRSSRPDYCLMPPESGSCDGGYSRYYYDDEAGLCKRFTYGGCDGNDNNFGSRRECLNYCG